MSATLVVSLVLVFGMGIAIQRGNTCTVVVFDDIVHRGSWARLLSIVYAWLWVAGGLTVLALTTGFRPAAMVVSVTGWSVAAGLLLGVGAVTNGACTTGTIARIGSGEYVFGLTLVGFYLGCVLAPRLFGRAATTHLGMAPADTVVDHPVIALTGLVLVGGLTLWRLVFGPTKVCGPFCGAHGIHERRYSSSPCCSSRWSKSPVHGPTPISSATSPEVTLTGSGSAQLYWWPY